MPKASDNGTKAELPEPDPGADVDAILPAPGRVVLDSGTQVDIEELRLRQFLALLRIITHGGAGALTSMRLDPSEDTEAFVTKLVAMLVMSIPDAEDEAVAFLRTVVAPAGAPQGRGLSKADKERGNAAREALAEELHNPSLEDTLTILEAVVRREAPHLQSLGKRLASMFEMARKAGQLPTSLTSTAPNS